MSPSLQGGPQSSVWQEKFEVLFSSNVSNATFEDHPWLVIAASPAEQNRFSIMLANYTDELHPRFQENCQLLSLYQAMIQKPILLNN